MSNRRSHLEKVRDVRKGYSMQSPREELQMDAVLLEKFVHFAAVDCDI